MDDAAKYWAFISYSHDDDGWGKWLHRATERYRTPKRLVGRASRDGVVPKRAYPIFRDREELPTSADLGATIRDALEQSRYLIVICSPSSAKSIWVNEEVRQFKRLGRENRILCLITGGEPNATDKEGTEAEECFCPALRFALDEDGAFTDRRTEPIAADARPGKDPKPDARLKLLAGLLGVDFDELKQRDKRRRAWRRVQVAAASVAALLVAGGIWLQGERQVRDEAWQKARAESLRLAELSVRQTEMGNATNGLLLALEALPDDMANPGRPFAIQAENALYRAMYSHRELTILRGHQGPVERVAFSPDGRTIVTGSWGGTARLWDATTGAEIAVLRSHNSDVLDAAFSPDGDYVITSSWDRTARIWDPASGTEITVLSGHEAPVNHAEFSPNGRRVLTASMDSTSRIWDAKDGVEIAVLRGHEDKIAHAAFSPDGSRIVTASYDDTARLWDAVGGVEIAVLRGHESAVVRTAFDPSGNRVVTASFDGTARLWDVTSGDELAVLAGHVGPVWHTDFNYDGSLIVTEMSRSMLKS